MTIHVPPQYPSHVPCKLAFVGEAPSDEELEKGIPFVGPAGRIFDAMLRTANLERSEYMVTNVFDEQLPDNEVFNWCATLKEAREGGFSKLPPIGSAGFLRPEYHSHLSRLEAELMDVRPTVVVPLGGTALWAFTGDATVGSHRGAVTPATRIVPGMKMVPTYHPSYIQKQWMFFSVVVGDFEKALYEASRGPQIFFPKRELFIEPSLADLDRWTEKLLASDLLSVDIETGWGQITCIGFAPDAERAIVVPFVDIRKPNKSYWKTPDEELRAWFWVKEIMESDVPKLGQNFGGYDAYWFVNKMGIGPRNYLHDTRLMHHALYPELPKSLEFLGANYTEQGAWKSWAKRKKEKKDD